MDSELSSFRTGSTNDGVSGLSGLHLPKALLLGVGRVRRGDCGAGEKGDALTLSTSVSHMRSSRR